MTTIVSYLQRTLQNRISERIGENKVLLLYGTRRVGKTRLLRQIQEAYQGSSMMMNGEDNDIKILLANRSVSSYRQMLGDTKLLLIDEAQTIPEIGKILKLMIDSFEDLTIIATGSSSFDLMNKSGEPLTGRSYTYHLYPVSQEELMNNSTWLEANNQLSERLVYGNYPEVLTIKKPSHKQEYLENLVQNYLLKDIFEFENVKNSRKIHDLMRLLAYQTGSEVSLDELGRQLGMSKNTVERYLDLLTKVFVIYKLGGYSTNLRKEVTKSAKWYFFDNGIRNALIKEFKPLALRQDVGSLWESYVISERIKTMHYNGKRTDYFFWRTYDRQEVDLIEREGQEITAFEFKFKAGSKVKKPKFFEESYPNVPFELIDSGNYTSFMCKGIQ
jgi:hypothetical protein